jgi:hypothetical protein
MMSPYLRQQYLLVINTQLGDYIVAILEIFTDLSHTSYSPDNQQKRAVLHRTLPEMSMIKPEYPYEKETTGQ